MDNDGDILKNFGGLLANDLNSALKLDDDIHDSARMIFNHSPYVDINDLSSINLPGNRHFNVLSVNIQSINSKFNSLLGFLQILSDNNISVDVINLQETWVSESWLSDSNNINLFNIPGYKLLSKGKHCCGHGGLFSYVKDKYQAKVRSVCKQSKLYEALFFDIASENLGTKLTVGNIYRPSTKSSDNNSELSNFIN